MVWTPEQTGEFLDHIADDRLYALFHLIAYRGPRRGEACGARWTDSDLDEGTLGIVQTILQLGRTTHVDSPKSEMSARTIALDTDTTSVLRAHRARQNKERLAAGSAWTDSGLIFTTPGGAPLHPADVTDHFTRLVAQAGLPPIRLHDLRHGSATLALKAGVEMKTVQEMLGHSTIALTADTYTSVLPEVAREAAERIAAIVPRKERNDHRAAM